MKKKTALILTGIILIFALILIGVVAIQKKDKPDGNTQTGMESEVGTESGKGTGSGNETESENGAGTGNGAEQDYLISLGNDLYIHDLVNITGTYVEDGKDEAVEKVAAITVENRSEKTLQLANIYLQVEGVEYAFSLTTLPPGTTAMVQENQKQTFPDMEKLPAAKTEHVTFFGEEPSLHKDVFEVTTSAYSIEVENKSEGDIAGPIYVYYKTIGEEYYRGGITYRVQIPGLAAGESYTAYAGHFYGKESQVMYIDYAK